MKVKSGNPDTRIRIQSPESLACFVVIAILGVALGFLQDALTMRGVVTRQVFPDYIAGQSDVIFVSRVLMRGVLRGIWELVGGDLRTINLAVQCVAAVIGVGATWLAARRWLGGWEALGVAFLASGWLCWGLARFTGGVSYPYDFPAFAFSALGVAAVAWGWWPGVALAVLVGGFNKETVFWLVPLWFFARMAEPEARRSPKVWAGAVALGLLFVAVYLTPRLLFPASGEARAVTMSWIETDPGAPAPGSPRIWQNFRLLFLLNPTYGLPWIHVALVFHVISWALYWRTPREFRWMMLAVPFFVAPTVLVGNVWELRIFNELVPFTAMTYGLALRGVRRAAGEP